MEQQKRDPKAQENTSLRLGLQERLQEDVKAVKENPKSVKAAKAARFKTTGESEAAPRVK